MSQAERPRPLKEATRITQMLDMVMGADRFDRGPVDIAALAMEYSASIAPDGRIHEVVERDIPGCVGALVCSNSQPRQWAIMYHVGQSQGRRAYTIGHEFGHFILHRKLIETDPTYDLGIYCNEEAVLQRDGQGIELEADAFAAALLMPFHDFRAQLPAKARPDFEMLGHLAKRYGVSLTAAILRWLEYTETRAMLVVSNEGFAHWAKSSKAALQSGRYIRTRNELYELPALATAVTRGFTEETKAGIQQRRDVWFPEPVIEMCLRSDRYDQELTLLHFEDSGPAHQDEEEEASDSFDRFMER
jgi:Zn-dependent peptidase ImmA (M78 family)